MKEFITSPRYIITIILFLTLCHIFILLIDGAFWDGVQILTVIESKEFDLLKMNALQHGGLSLYYFHLPFSVFENPSFVYKLSGFLCILILGIILFLFLKNFEPFISKQEALIITLFSLSFPAYHVYFEIIMLPYTVFSIFFWLGNLLLVDFYFRQVKNAPVLLAGIILISLSTFIPSYAVLYAPLVGLLLFFKLVENKPRFTINWQYLILIIPLLFFVFIRFTFPTQGIYADYNKGTDFSFYTYGTRVIKTIQYLTFDQMNAFFEILATDLIKFLIAASFVFSILFLSKIKLENNPKFDWRFLFIGLLLLGIGMFPYVFVGKTPTFGWNSRHALLLLFPSAIICVAALRLLPSIYRFISYGLILGIFVTFHWNNYVQWEARNIKNMGLMESLKKNFPDNSDLDILIVKDNYRIVEEVGYHYYDYSTIFKNAWNNEKTIGFDYYSLGRSLETEIDEITKTRKWEPYLLDFKNMKDFNFERAKMNELLIEKNQNLNPTELLLNYYQLKFFDNSESLKQFKIDLINLSILNYPN